MGRIGDQEAELSDARLFERLAIIRSTRFGSFSGLAITSNATPVTLVPATT
jgi:hypothetical protein